MAVTMHAAKPQIASPDYALSGTEYDLLVSGLAEFARAPFSEEAAAKLVDQLIEIDAQKFMPAALRGLRRHFRSPADKRGFFVVDNLPIDQDLPGSNQCDSKRTALTEMSGLLLGSMLGTLVGYSDKRKGAIVQNLTPKPGDSEMQSGTGSVFLEWHTDEAFHQSLPDFVLLYCLRGDPDAHTFISLVNLSEIDPNFLALLKEPAYVIRPDETHLTPGQQLRAPVVLQEGSNVCVRFDPLYTQCDSARHAEALEELKNYLIEKAWQVSLRAGQCAIFDNRRTVHARSLFRPRFDGSDRWLQKYSVLVEDRLSAGATPVRRISPILH